MSEQTDRELDAQIATKIFNLDLANPCIGLTTDAANGSCWSCSACGWYDDHGAAQHNPIPRRYSSDISAAMEVVNCLRLKGVGITITMPVHAKEYVWIEMNVPSSECKEWGNTLPEAICKCALKAFDKFNLAALQAVSTEKGEG